MSPAEVTRIIGIGNPLMADDGLGIRAIELLQARKLTEHVELIDGGCGGLKLLPLFRGCRKLIIIDAADFNAAPGTIRVLENPASNLLAASQHSSAHHLDLAQTLQVAEKLTQLPPLTLFLMQINSCHPEIRLSNELESALPELLNTITMSL